jgi:hypothetical protein
MYLFRAAATAYEPRTRAASALSPRPAAAGTTEEGQRAEDRGASPTGHRTRTQRPPRAATQWTQGPGAKLDPPDHTHPSPAPPWSLGRLDPGPRGRTVASISAFRRPLWHLWHLWPLAAQLVILRGVRSAIAKSRSRLPIKSNTEYRLLTIKKPREPIPPRGFPQNQQKIRPTWLPY